MTICKRKKTVVKNTNLQNICLEQQLASIAQKLPKMTSCEKKIVDDNMLKYCRDNLNI